MADKSLLNLEIYEFLVDKHGQKWRVAPNGKAPACPAPKVWRGAGAVDRACLENRYARKGIVSSNLTPAARQEKTRQKPRLFYLGTGFFGVRNRH